MNGTGVTEEEPVSWMAQTQPFAVDPGDAYRPSRIDLRLHVPQNATVDCYIEYNSDGEWHHLRSLHGDLRATVRIPIPPHPRDHFRLRLVGAGDVRVLGMGRTVVLG